MTGLRLTVVGCGDAFGSGGRGQSCYWLDAGEVTVALDFGATALVGLQRLGLDPDRLDVVVLSHLHGDHFGGLPYLLLHAQFDGRRDRPLTVVGPVGTGERLRAVTDLLYPGSGAAHWRFPLQVVDLPCGTPHAVGPLRLLTTEVNHPSGAPSTALRLEGRGRTLAFSGDTGWTEALIPLGRGADLFILECTHLEPATAVHLDLATIEANRGRLEAGRILLTHMSAAVLGHISMLEAKGYLAAHDGLELDV